MNETRDAALPQSNATEMRTRDALAEAMFKAQFSDPGSDDADREWMKRGLYETGYRASIVLGLLHSLGYELREVGA